MKLLRLTGELIAEGESLRAIAEDNRANLYGADLSGASLSGANLSGANLYRADLYRADLYRADLYRADLTEANLTEANLSGAHLIEANLSGTCLDPSASPNGGVGGFEFDGEFVIGYRTRSAGHIDIYRDKRFYSADWFSVSDTECHPGLYLWPTIELARNYSGDEELIRVRTRPCEVHKAGSKWRCRWFEVIGSA